jgi:hypothetical protein
VNKVAAWLIANRGVVAAAALAVVAAVVFSTLVGLPVAFLAPLLIAMGLATWGIYRWQTRNAQTRPLRAPVGTIASSAALAVVAVLLAAQAVPYGRNHANPPITGEPRWSTPETRTFMVRACFDCHSNEVSWPWYSNIAPISWAVTKHVEDGRNKVNYSEWDRPQRDADESFEEVEKGSMPPGYYTFGGFHSDATLTEQEMTTLLEGLLATPGLSR